MCEVERVVWADEVARQMRTWEHFFDFGCRSICDVTLPRAKLEFNGRSETLNLLIVGFCVSLLECQNVSRIQSVLVPETDSRTSPNRTGIKPLQAVSRWT